MLSVGFILVWKKDPTSLHPPKLSSKFIGLRCPMSDSRDVSLPVSDNLLTNYCLNALGWKYSCPRYRLSRHRPLFLSQVESRRFTERPERTRLAEPSGERPVHVLWETRVSGERTAEKTVQFCVPGAATGAQRLCLIACEWWLVVNHHAIREDWFCALVREL